RRTTERTICGWRRRNPAAGPNTTPDGARWRASARLGIAGSCPEGAHPGNALRCRCGRSGFAQHADQIRFPFAGIAAQPEFLRAPAQRAHGPGVIRRFFAAALSYRGTTLVRGGVGDAGRLLLRLALVPKILVQVRVLEAAGITPP